MALKIWKHGSIYACHQFFYFYFWERDSFILTKSLFTKFFIILAKFKQGRDEQNTGAFGRVHKVHFWKATYASFAKIFLKRFWALPYLQHELDDFTQQIWKVSLQGFVQKDMHPKFTIVLLQSSLTKIQLHAEFD